MRENGVYDTLTNQYFPRAHKEERKEVDTGLITVGAKSSLVVEAGGGDSRQWALETLVKRASKPNKITAAPSGTYMYSLPI